MYYVSILLNLQCFTINIELKFFRYIYHEKIDQEHQMKTHIFSPFFYECLQRALKKSTENGKEYVY